MTWINCRASSTGNKVVRVAVQVIRLAFTIAMAIVAVAMIIAAAVDVDIPTRTAGFRLLEWWVVVSVQIMVVVI